MKAVLVMEMPDKCLNCPLHQFVEAEEGEYDAFVFCNAENWREPITHQPVENLKERPDWCPLRPLPERKEYLLPDGKMDLNEASRYGWNKCLDEIVGETE